MPARPVPGFIALLLLALTARAPGIAPAFDDGLDGKYEQRLDALEAVRR